MNRYEFEDLISDYLENELSFSKRKKFENYLKNNPHAESLLKSVGFYKQKISLLPRLKVSETFTDNLLKKIKANRISSKNIQAKTVVAGFSPTNVSLLAGLFIAFIVVSIQLFDSHILRISKYENELGKIITAENIKNVDVHKNSIASSDEDSTQTNDTKNANKELTGQIRLVKD